MPRPLQSKSEPLDALDSLRRRHAQLQEQILSNQIWLSRVKPGSRWAVPGAEKLVARLQPEGRALLNGFEESYDKLGAAMVSFVEGITDEIAEHSQRVARAIELLAVDAVASCHEAYRLVARARALES